MAKKIKCGVIGCGIVAPSHVQGYQLLDNVAVTWACDIVEEKARALAAKHGIPRVTADYTEVLRDAEVDCISVCTDHASHAPITAAALAAGKHVLCEKALAANAAGLDRMFAAHAKHPELVFSGVFQHRFDAVFQQVKRLVEQGAFGTILTAAVQVRCLRTNDYYRADQWRGTWAHEGGAVLINQAIHFIDALVWIMGGVAALCGTYSNLTHGDAIETEDTAVATLRFGCGALGTLEATCSSHLGWEHTLSIHGSHGSLDLRDGTPLKVAFDDAAAGQRISAELAACREQQAARADKLHYGASHPTQIADFIEAIQERRAPFVSALSARHTVEVVLAIYESHRRGCWVRTRDRDAC